MTDINVDIKANASGYRTAAQEAKKITGDLRGEMEASAQSTANLGRQIAALGKEVATGDFSRMPGTLASIATRTGATSAALGALVTPLGLVGVAAAAFGVAMYQGGEQTRRLNDLIILTGNAAGQTTDQLNNLAEQAGEMTGRYTDARAAVEALAGSGKLSGEQVEIALKGVLATSQATGKEVGEVARQFEKIADNPVKAIVALNDQYNFLTADIFKQIKALQDQGKTQEAATLALNTFASTMDDRSGRMVENAGAIEQAWAGVKSMLDSVKDALLSIGRDDTLDEQISEKAAILAANRKYVGSGLIGADTIAAQEKELADLKRQRDTAAFLAKEVGDSRAKEKEKIDQLNQKPEKTGSGRAAKTPKYTEPKSVWEDESKALQKLFQDASAAVAPEQALSEKLQTRLDLYKQEMAIYQDPAMVARIQSLIEQTTAQEELNRALEFEQNLRAGDERELALLEEQSSAEAEHTASLEQKAQAIRELLDPTIALMNTQAEMNELVAAGVLTEDEATAALKKMADEADKTKSAAKEIGLTFASAFEDAVVGGKKFGEVLQGLAADIERIILRKTITEPLTEGIGDWFDSNSGGIGDFFSGLFGGGRAAGGGVSRGMFYEVNENSPELLNVGGKNYLMMGGNDGYVSPPAMLSKPGASSRGGSNVTVNIIGAPAQPQVQQRDDGNGNMTIDVMFERVESWMSRRVAKGEGLAEPIQSRFGLAGGYGAQG